MGEDTDKIILGPAAVYMGVAGQEPTTHMGYLDEEGAKFTASIEKLDQKSANKLGKIKTFVVDGMASVEAPFLQVDLDTLAKCIPGVTKVGNTLYFDPTSAAMQEYSIKIVSLNPASAVREFKALYVTPVDSFEQTLSASAVVKALGRFETLAKGTYTYTISDEVTTATLSSGTFTRTAGVNYYRVAGEGGAADAMTSIGGSLTDGEVFILQIASADDPITLTHAADTLELDGAVDWVMTSLDDSIALQYVATGTKLVELGRINASAYL